jgi:hypothetical protein
VDVLPSAVRTASRFEKLGADGTLGSIAPLVKNEYESEYGIAPPATVAEASLPSRS